MRKGYKQVAKEQGSYAFEQYGSHIGLDGKFVDARKLNVVPPRPIKNCNEHKF
jgi:hypothetical protein